MRLSLLLIFIAAITDVRRYTKGEKAPLLVNGLLFHYSEDPFLYCACVAIETFHASEGRREAPLKRPIYEESGMAHSR